MKYDNKKIYYLMQLLKDYEYFRRIITVILLSYSGNKNFSLNMSVWINHVSTRTGFFLLHVTRSNVCNGRFVFGIISQLLNFISRRNSF